MVSLQTPRRAFLRAAVLAPLAGRAEKRPQLRELLARYVHCVIDRNADALARLFSEHAEYRDVSFGVQLVGRDAIRNMFSRTFTAIAEATFLVKSSAFDRETIAMRWETTGRHQGPLLGMPGSGRPITFRGASFLTVGKDGVIEQVDYLDRSGIERQLGVRGATRE
jgi:steroid delta-isomerase-like uncharacterized protein